MEAYSRAVHEARTDLLEIDIWKSADDQLILNHDGIIAGLVVTEETLDQLRQIDPQLVTLEQVLGQYGLALLLLTRTNFLSRLLQFNSLRYLRWRSSST